MMVKVHSVKKARKPFVDKNGHQVNIGDTYYWWEFAFGGGKIKSKRYPKKHELTRNVFYKEVYRIEEDLENKKCVDFDDLFSLRDTSISHIETLISAWNEKLSSTLTQRQRDKVMEQIDLLTWWMNDLSSLDFHKKMDINDVRNQLRNCLCE